MKKSWRVNARYESLEDAQKHLRPSILVHELGLRFETASLYYSDSTQDLFDRLNETTVGAFVLEEQLYEIDGFGEIHADLVSVVNARNSFSAKLLHGVDKAFLVTSSVFSGPARKVVEDPNYYGIELVDLEKLRSWWLNIQGYNP